jgi:hypothetical protein
MIESFKKFYLKEMPHIHNLDGSPQHIFDLQIEEFVEVEKNEDGKEPKVIQNYDGFVKYLDTIFRAEKPIRDKNHCFLYLNTKEKKKQFWIFSTADKQLDFFRLSDISNAGFPVDISTKKGIIKRKDTGEIIFDVHKYLELPDTKEMTDQEIMDTAEYELKNNLQKYGLTSARD